MLPFRGRSGRRLDQVGFSLKIHAGGGQPHPYTCCLSGLSYLHLDMIKTLLTKWHAAFGKSDPDVIVRAPGRVNIIGEHTDYNEGWVMPGALAQSVYVLISKNKKSHHWIADNINEEYNSETAAPEDQLPLWVKYIQGALKLYDTKQESFFNILIGGDLPVGAGLSSSSSLVCGALLGFQKIFGKKESKEDLANIASRVEREIIGLDGGIMDQYAVMLSKAKHVMLLDCRTEKHDFLTADLPKCKWILINTKVKHKLIDTDYNERANECKRAVSIIQHQFDEVKSLRDVTQQILSSIHLPSALARRVKFVLEENARVQEMVTALKSKKPQQVGQILKASHKGLRNDYEVSSEELDHLADFANKFEGVHGARMMGGGFGGCVLCLVDEKTMDDFLDEIKASYFVKYTFDPEVINVEFGGGAEVL